MNFSKFCEIFVKGDHSNFTMLCANPQWDHIIVMYFKGDYRTKDSTGQLEPQTEPQTVAKPKAMKDQICVEQDKESPWYHQSMLEQLPNI